MELSVIRRQGLYKRSVKFDPLGPKGSDGKVESCLSVYKNLGLYFCVMIKCLLFSGQVIKF